MRLAAVTAVAALALVAACGSDAPRGSAPTTPPAPTSASPSSPAPENPSAEKARASVVDDVQEFAPALEQVFFSQGYPTDLAGALRTAQELTNLQLERGNTIASYRFDDADQEFQLCVENTGGAYAVYDTAPMSTITSGDSGGCP